MKAIKCYYDDPSYCSNKLWQCQYCGEWYCTNHGHVTEKGTNVECAACEYERKEREEDETH